MCCCLTSHRPPPTSLVTSARVIDGQICYSEKNAATVYGLFQERFKLHKTIYQHKTGASLMFPSVYGFPLTHAPPSPPSVHLWYMVYTLHAHARPPRAAKSIEYMIVDALLLADPYLKIADRIHDPKRFVHLNDDILNEVDRSSGDVRCPSPFVASH